MNSENVSQKPQLLGTSLRILNRGGGVLSSLSGERHRAKIQVAACNNRCTTLFTSRLLAFVWLAYKTHSLLLAIPAVTSLPATNAATETLSAFR